MMVMSYMAERSLARSLTLDAILKRNECIGNGEKVRVFCVYEWIEIVLKKNDDSFGVRLLCACMRVFVCVYLLQINYWSSHFLKRENKCEIQMCKIDDMSMSFFLCFTPSPSPSSSRESKITSE